MPSTVNKGYAVPTTGSEVGTWGDNLNNNTFNTIDLNMAGVISKTVAGSNITLSASEAQNALVRLTGPISANIQLTSPNKGFYFVENLTSGNFTITVTNGVAGVVIPQGRRAVVFADTNGVRIVGSDDFSAGTAMVFRQTNAPSGWTKSTAVDDAGLRLTSGTVGSGGTVNFTTAFASQPVTGTNTGTAISVDQMPAHGHPFRLAVQGNADSNTSGGIMLNLGGLNDYPAYTGTLGNTPGSQISATGGGQAHTHTFTGTPINLAVKYVDLIIATKN